MIVKAKAVATKLGKVAAKANRKAKDGTGRRVVIGAGGGECMRAFRLARCAAESFVNCFS